MAASIPGLHLCLVAIVHTEAKAIRKRWLLEQQAAMEHERATHLLGSMAPPHVVERLRSTLTVSDDADGTVASAAAVDTFPQLVVLASDLVGFTTLASQMTPRETIGLLNMLYNAFDRALGEAGLYKIGTIGDAYLVSSGLEDTRPVAERARDVAQLAQKMLALLQRIVDKHVPESGLQMRIGLDVGTVHASVLGNKLPQYRAWGDAMDTATAMESGSEPGRVRLSERFCAAAPEIPSTVEHRGDTSVCYLQLAGQADDPSIAMSGVGTPTPG